MSSTPTFTDYKEQRLYEYMKVQDRIKALQAFGDEIKAEILAMDDAPQKFEVKGVGKVYMKTSSTTTVDGEIIKKQLGADKALSLASWKVGDLKKGLNVAQMKELNKAGAIIVKEGATTYAYTAEKKK